MSDKITPPVAGEKIVIKKTGGCRSFFAGFFCAIIFLVLVIGGAGVYVYYGVSLRQIEDMFGIQIPIEGDLNNKNVKDLIALGLDVKDSYVNMTIGEVDTKLGVKLPDKFPGTDINISYLYQDDAIITFLGTQQKVLDVKVLDVANNLNAFVESLLDIVYDHLTVGEVLRTADLDETINSLGYPGLTDAIYTIDGNKMALSDMTINQAQQILQDYYGADNLTVANVIEATGIKIIPDDPMYDGLRALKVQSVTTDELMDTVTGEILNDLVDLSDFAFTQTEGFNNTKLSGMIDYIESLQVGEFVTLENAVDDNFFTQNPQFSTLNKTYIAHLDEEINKLTVSQILTTEQLNRTSLTTTQRAMTIAELLQSTSSTLSSLFGTTNINELGGYIEALKDTVSANYATEYNALSWSKKLGLEGSNVALFNISSLTINEIANSSDIPDTIFDKLGTLGDLMGDTSNSILKLLADVEVKDLFKNASDTIINALEYNKDGTTVTLATLLDMQSTDGINGIIGDIPVKDLFDTPDTAITNALKNSTTTLGDLLGMTSATGLNSIISTIRVGVLFDTPETALTNALKSSDMTLADMLEITIDSSTASGYILNNLDVSDLFGDDASTVLSEKINSMPISCVLGTQPTTEFLSLIDSDKYTSTTVATLDSMINSVDITNVTLGTMVDKGIISQQTLTDNGIDTTSTKWNTLKDMTLVDIIKAYYNALP